MVAMSLDVIAFIVEHVDDRNTLFSLLTVNRQVFRQTCTVLYRDPFRFLRGQPLTDHLFARQRLLLLQLLLTLSPAVDDDANLVRSVYDVPPKDKSEAEDPSTMMLDYLSFVKCARLMQHLVYDAAKFKDAELLDKTASSSGFISTFSFIHSTATRMICHHQPDDIEELEIAADDISRFVELVPHFRSLRYISIIPFSFSYDGRREILYFPTLRLIQAFQQHYGKDQLLECDAYGDGFCFLQNTFFESVGIAKLLPPRFAHTLKLVHPVRPMDSYVSRLGSLATTQGSPYWWDEISKDYTDMSAGHILQRCRSLVYLAMDCDEGGIHDANVLGWAAEEARQRAITRPLVPAVPLEKLVLTIRRRPLAMALQILVDATIGFSQSLQSLQVDYRQARRRRRKRRLLTFESAPVAMTQLTELVIKSTDPRLVNGRLLTMCTNLTDLKISLDDYKEFNGCLHDWLEICMPNLESLWLKGCVIELFDPVSLHHMPRLHVLLLSAICEDTGSSRDDSPPPRNRRWTWDWHLPMLTDLVLQQIAFSSSGFSFKVLRGCPSLVRLTIGFPEFEEQQQALFPIEIVSALTDYTKDVFPNLSVLELLGRYSLLAEDLEALIGRVLPGLERLVLDTVSPCTATQVVEYTKRHAMLAVVKLWHPCLDEEMFESLGLVDRSTMEDDSIGEGVGPAISYEFEGPEKPGRLEYFRRQ